MVAQSRSAMAMLRNTFVDTHLRPLRSGFFSGIWAPLLATSGLCVTATAADSQTATAPTHRAVEAGVDTSIQPGEDFFAYANGAWLKATEIPAAKERWTARNDIDELTRQQIAKLIDDAAAAPAGSDARKVADFRAAYLNEAAIEARGLASLKPSLDRIDGVHDKVALARLLGSELRADVDPLNSGIYDSSHLFGLSVESGLHGEKINVAFLLQGGLGLPDREQYISTAADMQALRAKYQDYIGRMLALAGFEHAAQRAVAVMALETAIARSHATAEASANDRNADNLWPRADFVRQAPGMDWAAFFAAAGLSKQDAFVVWQPDAVKGSAALVDSQPLTAWLDYLRFHVIDRHADVLPRAFAEQAFALHGTDVAGQQPGPRAQRAMQATQQEMSGALGRMYAERHFPPQMKARVQAIVANVNAAFRQRIEALTWMSAASKTMALAKLQAVYFDVGYPPKWQDYSGLRVDPLDAAGNLQRVAQWNYHNALARLGQPVDMTEWWIGPQTVGAVLVFQQNSYNFPAALLQAPKFDPNGSDAANYGAIGAIVGHETSHFVDTLGADYDAAGSKTHWWTAADLANFQAATAPLVNQFSSYRPFADMSIDGKLTLVENVADLGGLAAAFDAYRRTLGSKANDKEYVRQQDRQFFIGFARAWRSKATEAALRRQVATNDHAPESFRISTVRNIDAWYEAFDVLPGQRLYLEPQARVRIW
jgi:predicted metalloendopeptidase